MKRSQDKKVKPYISKRSKLNKNEQSTTTTTTATSTTTSTASIQQSSQDGTKHKHTKAITKLRWNPSLNTNTIASSSLDGQIIIWNSYSNERDSTIEFLYRFTAHEEAVKDLKWSQDGMSLLTASFDKTCKMLDANTGMLVLLLLHYLFYLFIYLFIVIDY